MVRYTIAASTLLLAVGLTANAASHSEITIDAHAHILSTTTNGQDMHHRDLFSKVRYDIFYVYMNGWRYSM